MRPRTRQLGSAPHVCPGGSQCSGVDDSQCSGVDEPYCCCRTELFPLCDGECQVCPELPPTMPSYDCSVTPTSHGECIQREPGLVRLIHSLRAEVFYKCVVNITFTGCVGARPFAGETFPSFEACNAPCVAPNSAPHRQSQLIWPIKAPLLSPSKISASAYL
jgi:hypothetical protein